LTGVLLHSEHNVQSNSQKLARGSTSSSVHDATLPATHASTTPPLRSSSTSPTHNSKPPIASATLPPNDVTQAYASKTSSSPDSTQQVAHSTKVPPSHDNAMNLCAAESLPAADFTPVRLLKTSLSTDSTRALATSPSHYDTMQILASRASHDVSMPSCSSIALSTYESLNACTSTSPSTPDSTRRLSIAANTSLSPDNSRQARVPILPTYESLQVRTSTSPSTPDSTRRIASASKTSSSLHDSMQASSSIALPPYESLHERRAARASSASPGREIKKLSWPDVKNGDALLQTLPFYKDDEAWRCNSHEFVSLTSLCSYRDYSFKIPYKAIEVHLHQSIVTEAFPAASQVSLGRVYHGSCLSIPQIPRPEAVVRIFSYQ
jgi:hypothetical protein